MGDFTIHVCLMTLLWGDGKLRDELLNRNIFCLQKRGLGGSRTGGRDAVLSLKSTKRTNCLHRAHGFPARLGIATSAGRKKTNRGRGSPWKRMVRWL